MRAREAVAVVAAVTATLAAVAVITTFVTGITSIPEFLTSAGKGRSGVVEPPRPASLAFTVRSNPPAAETFLDWQPRGLTPMSLPEQDLRGLLVVAKDGYRAAFARLGVGGGREAEFTLLPEVSRPRTHVLLLARGPLEPIVPLQERLRRHGLTLRGPDGAAEFLLELDRAGGFSNRAFRAWARARFDTDVAVIATVQRSVRALGDQDFGYPVRESVKGVVRVQVVLSLEAIDLASGRPAATVSGEDSAFGGDEASAFEKALDAASAKAAELLARHVQS